jgi:DMSO/TMAO reductase YedYZ molybdopterin-dependent catalytic subunit
VAAFLLSLPSTVWSFAVKIFPVRTVENETFKFNPDTGKIEWDGGKIEAYQLVVDGQVEKPLNLSYNDLKSLPQTEQVSDFHCVEGWSVQDIKWGGFRLEQILKKVSLKPEAKYAIFHSLGETRSSPEGQKHYIESFPVGEMLDPEREILLVLNMDGKPLPHDHGAPLRLIAPYDLAYKSIKFICRIEFSDKVQPGWWTLANSIYPVEARVPERRLRKK